MLQQLFRDSAVYGVSTVLSRGVALLLIPVYTYALSPEEYGVVDFLTIIATLVHLTVALEISQGFARYYSDAQGAQEKVTYASTALWFSVAAYAVFTLTTLAGAPFLSEALLNSSEWKGVFSVAVVATAATGLFFHLQNQLRWEFKAKGYALASVVFAFVSALTAAMLLMVWKIGPVAVFLGQLAGAIVGGVVSWFLARKSFQLLFAPAHCKEMVGFSLPLVVSSVAVFLSVYIDRFFIKDLLGFAEVGVYGVGYRLASVVGLLMAGFQGALTPLIYEHYMEASTPGHLARIFRYFLAAALPFALFIAVMSPEMVHLIAAPAYQGAWSVASFLVFGILLANMYIFAPGLFIAKRTGWFATINICAALVNALLNLALIPVLGLVGAAVATALTALLAFIFFMACSQRLYAVPHNWTNIVLATVVTLLFIWMSLAYLEVSEKWNAGPGFKIVLCAIGTAIIVQLLLRADERAAIRLKFKLAAGWE